MTFATLIRRGLRFHARAHFGVVVGAAIGSAALIGALLVGDSVRESLRQRALRRLPNTFFALTPTDRVFTHDLVSRLRPHTDGSTAPPGSAVLFLPGTAQMPDGGSRANHVHVIGVDQDFWRFVGQPQVREAQK